jgi:quercetin dioxygenase-like cupin family protein
MTAGGFHAAGAINIKATPTGSTSLNRLSTPSSLGSTEQVDKTDTIHIHPPAGSDHLLVVSERRISVEKMKEAEETHPGFTLVKPAKVSSAASL